LALEVKVRMRSKRVQIDRTYTVTLHQNRLKKALKVTKRLALSVEKKLTKKDQAVTERD
jgi:hypothetical protein